MANTFELTKRIARLGLPRLQENLVMPNLCFNDYSEEYEDFGATIRVRKPVVLEAKEFTNGTPVDIQDINEGSVEVSLNKIATVDVELTALNGAVNWSDEKFIKDFIDPAVSALAQKINADGLALAKSITATAQKLGTLKTTPSTLQAFSDVRKAMNKAKAPLNDRFVVWDVEADAKFTTIGELVKVDEAGTNEALREGNIGKVFGIQNYMSQAVATDTAGTYNLAFQRNGIAFVTRPLMPTKDSYVVNYDGISLRVTEGYDIKNKQQILSMDVLYGYKIIYPELVFCYQG